MASRIILVRHGPSAHVHRDGSVPRTGVFAWREAYDAAGIRLDAAPPREMLELVGSADHLIASDLRRAIESAERLAPNRAIRTSPLLRESALAIPSWPTRLPLGMWGTLMYTAWSYRIIRGIDPEAAEGARAATAAQWLSEIVSDGSTAVVVTHGVFRRLLGMQLVSLGWSARRRGGYRHWSAWTFTASPR